jgi:hypothetical protein
MLGSLNFLESSIVRVIVLVRNTIKDFCLLIQKRVINIGSVSLKDDVDQIEEFPNREKYGHCVLLTSQKRPWISRDYK